MEEVEVIKVVEVVQVIEVVELITAIDIANVNVPTVPEAFELSIALSLLDDEVVITSIDLLLILIPVEVNVFR